MKTSKIIKGPFADLTNDVAFKWVFGQESNRDILKALLNELLPDKTISDITLFKENNLGHKKGLKKGVFDISCKTDDGAYIDVEIQVRPQKWFADRCLYYSTYNIQSQIAEGVEDYTLKQVYVVSIDDFVREHGPGWKGEIQTHYSLREDSTGELMTDSLHFSFVELPLFKKKWEELENDKERFYFCFRHLHELKEIPEDMFEGVLLKMIGWSRVWEMPPKIRNKYNKSMTTEIDKRAQLKYAREQGLEQGLEKGLEQGRAEGLAEGEAKGKAEARTEMARALLKDGVDINAVAKYSGLSIEQVKAL